MFQSNLSQLVLLVSGFLIVACKGERDTIRIKGSDTEVNLAVLLAESYHLENPSSLLSISGGGSGMGIASLFNGTADIANSSREIKDQEKALFESKGEEVRYSIFAQDAVAIVVSDKNAIDSISVKQLAAILSGGQKKWELAPANSITIYGRQSNSGTYDFMKQRLGIEFSPYAKQMNGNAQILEAIKNDVSGIGYVGAGYLMSGNNEGLKVLKVYEGQQMAFSPLVEADISSGNYTFQRPLYQYFRAKDQSAIQAFLDFESSPSGLRIIRASGYYSPKKP